MVIFHSLPEGSYIYLGSSYVHVKTLPLFTAGDDLDFAKDSDSDQPGATQEDRDPGTRHWDKMCRPLTGFYVYILLGNINCMYTLYIILIIH